MNAWQVFLNGIKRAGQSWQVLIVLWLGELLPAFLLALLPALNLLSPAHLTAFQDAASGISGWMATELFASFSTRQQGLGFDLASVFNDSFFSTIFIWILIVPPIAWLSSSFLYGGMLSQYVDPGEAYRARRFFSNCWRWWGKNLLLGLVQMVSGLVVVGVSVVFLLIGFSLSTLLGGLILILAFLVLGLWLAFFELSRVSLAAREDHRIVNSLTSASSILGHKPWLLLGYYLLSLLGLLVIQILFRLGLFPRMPLAFWPLVLLLQQAFVILRLWSRAARYAGNVNFVTAA